MPRCDHFGLNEIAYAYLVYLGDGCLASMPRGVFKPRIVQDVRYPEIISEIDSAILAVRPNSSMRNASDDIRRIFCEARERFGIDWRRMNARSISVARRSDVAKLDSVIGPKR